MRIALPISGTHVSTVFDFAERLALVEIENNAISRRRGIDFAERIVSMRVAQLRKLEIDVLICGAISESAAMMINHSGIRLVQGITGGVDSVVEACVKGELNRPCYLLPGFEPSA